MSSEYQVSPQYVQTKKSFPWGCLLGGCATVFVLMLLMVVGASVGGYYFYKGQVTKYTAETPNELPTVEYTPDQIEEITTRVESFKTMIEKGEPAPPMILTADDINAMISQQEELRRRVYVRIDEGKVSADVSIPTDAIPGAQGRYFNGSVSANVSLDNGVLIVTLADAEVNGQPVPQEIIKAIGKQNLAKEIYQDPEVAKTLSKFESLTIDDDKIVLTPK